ncbi:MAG: hypothetical protein GF416_07805 [Candidatus Altiarchaeales archaeon]|nr:hypothetical protein [Candidatus Altiarchaeales archaeon]MBD3417017.1 hypothetical protein [Candidatus Altiarchaeales archaeon]
MAKDGRSKRARNPRSSLGKILHHFVGEICCVTKPIESGKRGAVRIWGSDVPAKCKEEVRRGQWVRVISHTKEFLHVKPLNVWLGSCCC